MGNKPAKQEIQEVVVAQQVAAPAPPHFQISILTLALIVSVLIAVAIYKCARSFKKGIVRQISDRAQAVPNTGAASV